MSEPMIYNRGIIRAMGLDRNANSPAALQSGHLKNLRIKDEAEFVRRFNWYNLPDGITPDLIERILYYKGQGMFFYVKELDEFYFLPYCMQGEFDVYGRYTSVIPVPFTGDSETKKSNKTAYISNFVRKPVWNIKLDLEEEDLYQNCVLLNDYTPQISQIIIPRYKLQEPVLSQMSELYPFTRTRLINSTGVKGMRVNNADDQENVTIASRNLVGAALQGDAYVPIVGAIEFQELTEGSAGANPQDFLMVYQSLDNIRKGNLGIASSGAFEKSAHTLESEQTMNASSIDLVLQDAIMLRQQFCNIINSIWNLGIWCEPAESLVMADLNGDGVDYDRDQGTNTDRGGEDNA